MSETTNDDSNAFISKMVQCWSHWPHNVYPSPAPLLVFPIPEDLDLNKLNRELEQYDWKVAKIDDRYLIHDLKM